MTHNNNPSNFFETNWFLNGYVRWGHDDGRIVSLFQIFTILKDIQKICWKISIGDFQKDLGRGQSGNWYYVSNPIFKLNILFEEKLNYFLIQLKSWQVKSLLGAGRTPNGHLLSLTEDDDLPGLGNWKIKIQNTYLNAIINTYLYLFKYI